MESSIEEVSLIQVKNEYIRGAEKPTYEGWIRYTPHDRWWPIWVRVTLVRNEPSDFELHVSCCNDKEHVEKASGWASILFENPSDRLPRVFRDRDTVVVRGMQNDGTEVDLEVRQIGNTYLRKEHKGDDLKCALYGRSTPTWQQCVTALVGSVALAILVRYRECLPYPKLT